MNFKALLSTSLLLAFVLTLMGCPGPNSPPSPTATPCPSPSPPSLVCVDFEPPLAVGTQYGQAAGQPVGTVIFTTNGVPVSIHDFVLPSGSMAFNRARIETATALFGSGQIININNINLEFDFSGIGFSPSHVQFDFLDQGGIENISVNGSPIFAGEFSAAPTPMGGVNIAVASTPVSGGKKGTVVLTGAVNKLRVGGQEFFIDQVCAKK